VLEGSCCKLHDQVCSCLKKNHNDLIDSLGSNLEKIDLKYFSENIKGKYTQKTIRRPQLNLFKGA
jgi:hypothetical protein